MPAVRKQDPSHVFRDRRRKRVSGIDKRIEELGELNDEFVRLMALPEVDEDGMTKLAQRYYDRGMKAMALNILRDAGLDESALRVRSVDML